MNKIGAKNISEETIKSLKKYGAWLTRVLIIYLLLIAVEKLFSAFINIEYFLIALEGQKHLEEVITFFLDN